MTRFGTAECLVETNIRILAGLHGCALMDLGDLLWHSSMLDEDRYTVS